MRNRPCTQTEQWTLWLTIWSLVCDAARRKSYSQDQNWTRRALQQTTGHVSLVGHCNRQHFTSHNQFQTTPCVDKKARLMQRYVHNSSVCITALVMKSKLIDATNRHLTADMRLRIDSNDGIFHIYMSKIAIFAHCILTFPAINYCKNTQALQ